MKQLYIFKFLLESKKIIFLFLLLLTVLSNSYSQSRFNGKCIKGDCENGKGTYEYSDGSRYEGKWTNGMRNGYGKQFDKGNVYKDFPNYKGQWKDDKREGKGEFDMMDVFNYIGNFKNDMFDGYGKSKAYNPIVSYDGEWKNNVYNGKGKLQYLLPIPGHTNVGSMLSKEGTWINGYFGVLHENTWKAKIYYDKNWKPLDFANETQATYYRLVAFDSNGNPSGIVKDYYITGELKSEFEAIAIDKLEGEKVMYKNNCIEYSKAGKKLSEEHYGYGNLDGISKFWYESGALKNELNYAHGKENGTFSNWYENGKKAREGSYKEGKLNGIIVNYDIAGKFESKSKYIDGTIISKWLTQDDSAPKDGPNLCKRCLGNGYETCDNTKTIQVKYDWVYRNKYDQTYKTKSIPLKCINGMLTSETNEHSEKCTKCDGGNIKNNCAQCLGKGIFDDRPMNGTYLCDVCGGKGKIKCNNQIRKTIAGGYTGGMFGGMANHIENVTGKSYLFSCEAGILKTTENTYTEKCSKCNSIGITNCEKCLGIGRYKDPAFLAAKNQKVIYLDKNWNKVSSVTDAEYFRVVTFDNNGVPQSKVRDYFISGELQWEGEPIYIDREGNFEKKYRNKVTGYYRNGIKAFESNYNTVGQYHGWTASWNMWGELTGQILYENGIEVRDVAIEMLKQKIVEYKNAYAELNNFFSSSNSNGKNNSDSNVAEATGKNWTNASLKKIIKDITKVNSTKYNVIFTDGSKLDVSFTLKNTSTYFDEYTVSWVKAGEKDSVKVSVFYCIESSGSFGGGADKNNWYSCSDKEITSCYICEKKEEDRDVKTIIKLYVNRY